MFRLSTRTVIKRTPTQRLLTRGYSAHGPEYGPEQPILQKSTIAWVSVSSVLFGLWYYDGIQRLSQSEVSPIQSVIGQKIENVLSIFEPSEETKAKMEKRKWEQINDNAHEGERHLILFSPNRKRDTTVYDYMPVPEPARRGIPYGRVITDVENIEPRKIVEQRFQPLPDDYRERQKELEWKEFKENKR